jgi:hypothetical protein
MKKIHVLSLMVIVANFLMIGCSKQGPVGPAGPTGNNGATGATGATGPQGPAGTANVIFSGWFTPAQNGNWVDTTINGVAQQKKFRKAAPEVTLSIMNTGVVLSYVKLNPDGTGGTTTTIRQLPYADVGQAREFIQLTYNSNITYAVTSTANPGVAIPAGITTTLEFRYVIIPGSVAGGRLINNGEKTAEVNGKLYTESQLKAMSYAEVCSLLKIQP